eukprot:15482739-Alexandrium_andersonii.AAC.1
MVTLGIAFGVGCPWRPVLALPASVALGRWTCPRSAAVALRGCPPGGWACARASLAPCMRARRTCGGS